MTTLYAKDGKGVIREWNIEGTGNGILITYGVLGGALSEQFEDVPCGKATRTLSEQIESRINSRINKKIDAGYCLSLEEATNKTRTNALGFECPMLAQSISKVKQIDYEGMFVQNKMDGNRCLITNVGGEKIAYSRNGKRIETIPELLEGIDIPDGVTLDGEIYCHNERLQTIVSWLKRKQEDTLRLQFHAYDIMMDASYATRFELLSSFNLGNKASVAETWKYDGKVSLSDQLNLAISWGYEGLILRPNNFGYENKRSKGLIKVKQFLDDEFLVLDISLSKQGRPVLTCEVGESTFTVVAPGTFENKDSIYRNKKEYIGTYAHVEFSQYTKDNVPFHPVCVGWRDKRKE